MTSEIGDEIRRRRLALLMTQDALHLASHVGRLTINRIENGQSEPSRTTIQRLAVALRMDVEVLWRLTLQGRTSEVILTPGHPNTWEKWNADSQRRKRLQLMAPLLTYDPPETSFFSDYQGLMRDKEWMNLAPLIQTTTWEFGTLWRDGDLYISYEAALLNVRLMGREIQRAFVVETNRMADPDYARTVKMAISRHYRLGLTPRILMLDDARRLAKALGSASEIFVVAPPEVAIIIGFPGGSHDREPFALTTYNKQFVQNASNIAFDIWRKARRAEDYVLEFGGLTDVENAAVEADLVLIHAEANFRL